MKNNKGQSALEFLLTYGWVILIISIAVILMWEWGFLKLSSNIPPGASGFWGVMPYENDFKYTKDGNLTISLSNKVGGEVTIKGINATVSGYKHEDSSPGITIPSGGVGCWDADLSSGVPPLAAGSNYNIFVSISYNDSRTSETYMSSGWLRGHVEE